MKQVIAKALFTLLITGFFTATSIAQQSPLKLAISYNTSTPLGTDFKNYISKTSFRGLQGSIMYNLNNDWRIGLQTSYNDFYQKYPRLVYKTTDGAEISAVLSNTLQAIPVVIKGEYSFVKNGWIKPYVGLGAGVNFINFDQFYGEFKSNRFYTKAAFSGDLGVVIPFTKSGQYAARISTSYNLSPFNEEGIKNINTWNVQAGVVFPLK
ncbi:MAG: outer membrane beta-barrel protein [Ferruginibacter sp.]